MAKTMKHGQPIKELYKLKEAFLIYFLLPPMRALWLNLKTVNVLALINIILPYSPWENRKLFKETIKQCRHNVKENMSGTEMLSKNIILMTTK